MTPLLRIVKAHVEDDIAACGEWVTVEIFRRHGGTI
jgi:hypothetical protein